MEFKKMVTYGVISLALVSFGGCNGEDFQETQLGLSKQIQESGTTTATTISTTMATTTTEKKITMKERFENSKWGGCDGSGASFSMQLDGDEIYTHTIDSSGIEKDVEGYWELYENEDKIVVYSDEDCTERLTYYDYTPIELSNGDMILAMEGMYVSSIHNDDELSDVDETIANNFDTLTNTLETGAYWVGDGNTCADFLVRNYDDIYLYVALKNPSESVTTTTTTTKYSYDEDEEEESEDGEYYEDEEEDDDDYSQSDDGVITYDGTWWLTYEYICIDDDNSGQLVAFNWDYDDDSETLRLTPIDDAFVEFTLSDAYTYDDAVDLVSAYLEDEEEEYTTTSEDEEESEESEETTTEDDEENPEQTTLAWVTFETTSAEDYTYYYVQTTLDANVDNPNYDDSTEYYDDYVPAITNSYALPITTTAYYNYSTDYNYNNYNNNNYGYDDNNYSTQAYGF